MLKLKPCIMFTSQNIILLPIFFHPLKNIKTIAGRQQAGFSLWTIVCRSRVFPSRCLVLAQTVKNLPAMQETRFDPWVGKIPWRRAWLPSPALLPGESHGQRSLTGYSPWGHRVGHNWATNTVTFQDWLCQFSNCFPWVLGLQETAS